MAAFLLALNVIGLMVMMIISSVLAANGLVVTPTWETWFVVFISGMFNSFLAVICDN